jgi:hypothetical protein
VFSTEGHLQNELRLYSSCFLLPFLLLAAFISTMTWLLHGTFSWLFFEGRLSTRFYLIKGHVYLQTWSNIFLSVFGLRMVLKQIIVKTNYWVWYLSVMILLFSSLLILLLLSYWQGLILWTRRAFNLHASQHIILYNFVLLDLLLGYNQTCG